jgi:hypothetical protein
MGLAHNILECRREIVTFRQRVVSLLASNIGPGRLSPGVIRELAEVFDAPVSTIYQDVRMVEGQAGQGRHALVNSVPTDVPPDSSKSSAVDAL